MFTKTLLSAFDAPNSKSQFASPSLSPRQAASDWIRKNPEASRRARAWLHAQSQDGPLHGSLLGFVHQEFGVPKPVSAWVKTFADLVALPPGNATSRHPLVGLRARMTDPTYLAHICVSLAASHAAEHSHAIPQSQMDDAPASGMSVAAEPSATAEQQPIDMRARDMGASPKSELDTPRESSPAPKASQGSKPTEEKMTKWPPETILVDGLNILRDVEFGTEGLATLLRVLKDEHHSPFTVFDANVFHVLRERDDVAGVKMVKEIVAHGEGKLVPAGTTADEIILLLADKFELDIVSLDLFKQYGAGFPWTQNHLEDGRRVHHPAIFRGELILAALGICVTLA